MATTKHSVNLQFNADISNVSKELDKLSSKLQQIGQGKGILGGDQMITKEMNTAMNSASKLSTILQKCRLDNGKLDIAAFKNSLQTAGLTAESLAKQLGSLGPIGVQAFAEISKAVSTAQMPIKKTQGLLGEFATTLKNTAKWQISSSILHGFMSSISGAYGYAQDLNESLNNIRIVSKQNTDQMAEFAKEANKAAKELSISTTAYTDAALIFYQQGLQGDAVTERTDVVAKMSNVTKDSVDEVSSYMTAIWNNFDDGSQSLEHYADVITGLGAATASSSAEIAQGLEKFAAVADTVGLSYDYATSALATVVAQTRQSADTVGTAFKTLFARIEGLKLGKTLEDGVDLNKYSQALATIGVDVIDTNGELRRMDDILEDMGAKWNQISQAQKVALAQTVAGTRQYNQLMALMDNWDKVQENLDIARSSDGELQKQADIYAESWEAAQKRVKAAWQAIYSNLVDDKFFIGLANGVEKVLEIVNKVIEAFGGFKGLLPVVLSGITSLFSKDIGLNLASSFLRARAEIQELRGDMTALKNEFTTKSIELAVKVNDQGMAAALEDYQQLATEISNVQQKIDQLDTVQQKLLEDILTRVLNAIKNNQDAASALEEAVKAYNEAAVKLAQEMAKSQTETAQQNQPASQTAGTTTSAPVGTSQSTEAVSQNLDEINTKAQTTKELIAQIKDYFNPIPSLIVEASDKTETSTQALERMQNIAKMLSNEFSEFSTVGLIKEHPEDFEQFASALQKIIDLANDKTGATSIEQINEALQKVREEADHAGDILQTKINNIDNANTTGLEKVENELQEVMNKAATAKQNIDSVIEGAKNTDIQLPENKTPGLSLDPEKMASGFASATRNALGLATALMQIDNLTNVWMDDTKTIGEQLRTTVMVAPMLLSSIGKTVNLVHQGMVAAQVIGEVLKSGNIITTVRAALEEKIKKLNEEIARKKAEILRKDEADVAALEGQVLAQKAKNSSGDTVAAGTETVAATEAGASGGGLASLLTGLISSPAVIAVAIAAVAGLTAFLIHKSNMKKLAQEAEKASAANEVANKKVEESGEELDKVDSLRDSYASLYDQIQKNTIEKEEARSTAIKLAAEYQDENLMVLALTEQYDALNEKIKEAQNLKRQEHLKDVQQSIEAGKTSLIANATQGMGSGVDTSSDLIWDNLKHVFAGGIFGLGYDYATGRTNEWEWGNTRDLGHGKKEKTTSAIEQLLGNSFEGFKSGSKITTQDFEEILNKAAESPKVFEDFMISINKAAAVGEKPAQKLRDLIKENDELINQLRQRNEEEKQLVNETVFNEQYDKYNEALTANEYSDLFYQSVVEKGADIKSITSQSAENANTTDVAAYGLAAQKFAEYRGWNLDDDQVKENVAKLVQGLTEEYDNKEVATLAMNIEFIGPGITTDENGNIHFDAKKIPISKEALGTLETARERRSNVDRRNALLNEYDASKGWSKKQKAELEDLGINTAAEDVDILDRLAKANEEDIKTFNSLTESIEKAKKELEDWLAEHNRITDEGYDLYGLEGSDLNRFKDIDLNDQEKMESQANNFANQLIQDANTESGADIYSEFSAGDIERVTGAYEDLKTVGLEAGKTIQESFASLAEGIADELPDDTKKFEEELEKVLEKFEDLDGPTKKALDTAVRGFKASKAAIEKYKGQLGAVQKYTNQLGKISENAADSIKFFQDRVTTASASMDKMQTAYKSLKGIEAQYAEDKFLTVDSFQELLSMEPKYLNALQFENGQLKVNEQTLQEVAIARVKDMEAKQADAMWAELDALEHGKLNEQELHELQTKYLSIAANEVAGHTMAQVEARARALAGANGELATTYNAIAQAASNYAAAASATIKGLQTNFPKAMGYTPKGGGGSKKSKETKDLKEYADEFDRFYPFQKVIDDLADAISDLAKEQEHLAGGELVGSIRYQNKLLQDQKKAYQELAKEQKKYQKEMQADLVKYGMSFDTASGNIVNYAQSTQAMLDRYNAAIEKYNKSAQSDADKKTLEAVEKEYEKFKKLVSNYQGILTEIQDTENNLDDIYYETIANNLKEFETMVQVKLDIGEARRMVNDFINEINKNFKTLRKTTEEWMSVFDNALKNAHTYIDGDLGTINVDLDALNKVKSAIDSGDYGHEGAMFVSETEAITKYKELAEQLKDDSKELYDLYKEAWEDYLDAVDDAIEQWEEIINNFDDINDTLDHYEKMIELLHDHQDTDQGYDELINLYNKQMDLQLAKQATLKKQIDALQSEYKELIASGANEYDEDVKKIQSSIKDANKALQGSLEAYVETMNKAFEKQANKAIDDYVNNMLGFNLSDYTEQWAREKKAMEGYYDVNERVMQIDRIRRKYNEAIAKTVDIKQQEKLAKLRDEELADLEKADKLAEKRVELSEKKLAVTQAEIALEEARDNKSQMRLQRDSQGNWNYQFVANDDDILDKEQNLADAVYDQYETAKQWAEKLFSEDIPNLANDLKEELSQIMSDTTLTAEEKSKKIQEVSEYYQNLIKEKAEETETARKELNEATAVAMIDMDRLHDDNFGVMNEHQQDLVKELTELGIQSGTDVMTAIKEDYDEIIKKADESNQQTMAGWNLLEEAVKINSENMTIAQQEFYDEIRRLNEEYDEAIRRSEEASGIAWSNIGFAIELAGDEISEVTSKIDECIEHSQALSDFRERVNDIESAWMGVRQSIIDALGSLDDYMQRLLEVREMQEEVKRNETDAAGPAEIDIATGEPMGGGGSRSTSSSSTSSSATRFNLYGNGSYGTWTDLNTKKTVSGPSTSSGSSYTRNAAKVSGVATGAKQLSTPIVVNNVATPSKTSSSTYNIGDNPYKEDTWAYKLREKLFGSRFASGGYTGEWGSDPRLALLDQKELVLNASDTSKILDTVKMVRDMNSSNNEFISYLADIINQSTDALAQAMESGINILGERMAYASDHVASTLLDAGSRQLEQNVHIDASFPNVSDRHEIEDAFNNLVNIASQRVLASDVLISDSYLI